MEGVTHVKGGDAIPGITKLVPGLSPGQGIFQIVSLYQIFYTYKNATTIPKINVRL